LAAKVLLIIEILAKQHRGHFYWTPCSCSARPSWAAGALLQCDENYACQLLCVEFHHFEYRTSRYDVNESMY